MVKFLRQLMTLSVLVLGFGAACLVQAADTPDPKSLEAMNVCITCHNENWNKPILTFFQTKHGVKGDPRTPGCQSCHGMSERHLESPVNSPDVKYTKGSMNTPEERTEKCLGCHKGEARTRWDGSTHQVRGVVCSNCHDIHRPQQRVLNKADKAAQAEVCFACHKEQRADFQKMSHMPVLEGKMACSDCHNPHGSAGPKLMKMNTVRETCVQCHAEKRGPFLFEHQPVTEDCTNCHSPHGSNQLSLLKTRPPYMCQECHDGPMGASAQPLGPVSASFQHGYAPRPNATTGVLTSPSNQRAGRSCLNCHNTIHGSNSPAGGFFLR